MSDELGNTLGTAVSSEFQVHEASWAPTVEVVYRTAAQSRIRWSGLAVNPANNDAMTTWIDESTSGSNTIRALRSRVQVGGQTLQAVAEIQTSVTPNYIEPNASPVYLANGSALLAWRLSISGGDRIMASLYSPVTNTWDIVATPIDGGNAAASLTLVLGIHATPDGGAWVVWVRSNGVYATRLSSTGVWQPPVPLVSSLTSASYSRSAVSPAGDLAVLWKSAFNGFLGVRIFDPNAGTWSAVQNRFPDQPGSNPSSFGSSEYALTWSGGNLLVAWQRRKQDNSPEDFVVGRFNRALGAWENSKTIGLESNNAAADLLQMAAAPNGGAVLAWTENRGTFGGGDNKPFYLLVNQTGSGANQWSLGTPKGLAPIPGMRFTDLAQPMGLVVDDNGYATVAIQKNFGIGGVPEAGALRFHVTDMDLAPSEYGYFWWTGPGWLFSGGIHLAAGKNGQPFMCWQPFGYGTTNEDWIYTRTFR